MLLKYSQGYYLLDRNIILLFYNQIILLFFHLRLLIQNLMLYHFLLSYNKQNSSVFKSYAPRVACLSPSTFSRYIFNGMISISDVRGFILYGPRFIFEEELKITPSLTSL